MHDAPTYRLDRIKARHVQLLNVIGRDSVLLENIEGLVRDGNLQRRCACVREGPSPAAVAGNQS